MGFFFTQFIIVIRIDYRCKVTWLVIFQKVRIWGTNIYRKFKPLKEINKFEDNLLKGNSCIS